MRPGSVVRQATERASWLLLLLGWGVTARADTVVFETPEGGRSIDGKLVARGGSELLFLGRDGRMHLLEKARVRQLEESDEQPKPFTKEEMVAQLRKEFGNQFDVFSTAHYLICYNSTPAFAHSSA